MRVFIQALHSVVFIGVSTAHPAGIRHPDNWESIDGEKLTLRSKTPRYILRTLALGVRRRCPACEQRGLFKTFYSLHSTCAYCGCRFARRPGDMIGSAYITILLAELSALIGFFGVQAAFAPPITTQLVFWVPYLLVFSVVFYPVARGLWVAILYLTGGVYPDPDYTREYYGPTNRIRVHRADTGEENG